MGVSTQPGNAACGTIRSEAMNSPEYPRYSMVTFDLRVAASVPAEHTVLRYPAREYQHWPRVEMTR